MADKDEINQVPLTSQDVRKERLQELQRLFPDLFDSEGHLDKKELENLDNNFSVPQVEKFQFSWAGKMQSKKIAFTPSKAALKPDKERSVNFDSTQNLIIEGDNLEALKLLQTPYREKIKCIYIDPPYNTGNDFIYPDNFSEGKKAYWEKNGVVHDGVRLDSNMESVGRYHSNWLNMMQGRLLMARNLLKEDGVIFVSIDENEIHNLRKLMDEIFGEENFVSIYVWEARAGKDHTAVNVSVSHEYVLCFAKNLSEVNIKKDERVANGGNYQDSVGSYRREQLRQWGTHDKRSDRPSMFYPVIAPDGTNVLPIKDDESEGCWRVSNLRMDKMIADGDVDFIFDGKRYQLYAKKRDGQVTKTAFGTLLQGVGTSSTGTLELKAIFKEKVFDTVKPLGLIKHLLSLIVASDKDSLILDFFAGSGTTAHAVIELNKEDGGNRKFILVQIPEYTDGNSEAFKAGFKTISDICIERVKRAGTKIKQENEKVDTGFKVFQLTYSNFQENLFHTDPEKTEQENIQAFDEHLAKAQQSSLFQFDFENLLYEIALKQGFELNFTSNPLVEFEKNKVLKIQDSNKEALVCLDESIDMDTIEKLKPYSEKQFICLKRALDTTKKWTLRNSFKRNLWVA